MQVLHIQRESTHGDVGLIFMTDAGLVTADTELAKGVFDQYRKRLGSDRETFELLAEGWSNGYYTIPALVKTSG